VALNAGTKLGPYEILSPLGAGGMGEVYRARDTRLDRTVAIKILPPDLAQDPILRARFEREAKAVSSLNHPHICTLHDVGTQDGIQFLVMECVEGETLANRLQKGPLPLAHLLAYGAQITDALDKAHRKGIVHRDLKPANIMLTKSSVKLLDFGLAKPMPAEAAAITIMTTPTAAKPLTAESNIIGTFLYMAPEQLEGKDADARSDIFALGAVLYEMATGKRAFDGKTQASVIAAILDREPPSISNLQPMLPMALDRLVKVCLAKDPEERWQTAHDIKLQLQSILESSTQPGGSLPASHRKLPEWLPWSAATLTGLIAVIFAVAYLLRAPKPLHSTRLVADIGTDAKLYVSDGTAAILSPDGTQLAFVATDTNQKRLIYVRPLDQLQATPLAGTENARDPFFSPDSQWLGFFADGKLKKILARGGAAITLCNASDDRGGTWSEDGTIVFTPFVGAPLSGISSAGDALQVLTSLDVAAGELTHRWPQFLPGGKEVLFTSSTAVGNYEDADIFVYSMASGRSKRVQRGGFHARYVPPGHLVYTHEGTLFAAPFDLKSLEVTGPPVPFISGVVTNPATAGAQFSFSKTGNLIYVPGPSIVQNVGVYWMDRNGQFTPMLRDPRAADSVATAGYLFPAFSPQGTRLALQIRAGKTNDIWVYDWERDTLTRLTFSEFNSSPVWTPDSERITYSSVEKGGGYDLYWKRADGAGDTLRLTQTKRQKRATSWRPDGKVLAFTQLNPDTSWDVLTMSMEGDEKTGWKPQDPKPFLNGPFNELDAAFSSDGHWLAYASNESGNLEVYVRPFPGPGGKWQVSSGGGFFPRWSRGTKQLFYRTPDQKIMAASYSTSGDSFRSGTAQPWSTVQITDRGPAANFDVHPDGKRMLVLKAPKDREAVSDNKLSFFFNFFDELRGKAPPAKN